MFINIYWMQCVKSRSKKFYLFGAVKLSGRKEIFVIFFGFRNTSIYIGLFRWHIRATRPTKNVTMTFLLNSL